MSESFFLPAALIFPRRCCLPFGVALEVAGVPRRAAHRALAAADNLARVCADIPRRRLPLPEAVEVEPEPESELAAERELEVEDVDEPPSKEASRVSKSSI